MVGRDGFEPSKAKPTDLQSVAFDRSATYPYATVILVVILLLLTISWVEYYCDWSWWSESNQQPIDYKSIALPLSHTSILKKLPNILPKFKPNFWCLGAESNHRHEDFQSSALPTELPRQNWRRRWGSNPRPPA